MKFKKIVLLNGIKVQTYKIEQNDKKIQQSKEEDICHFCPTKRKRNSKKLFPLNGKEIQKNCSRSTEMKFETIEE